MVSASTQKVSEPRLINVLRPVGDGMKRRAHDADLKRMVVIRSSSPQLALFKLHLFRKQRRESPVLSGYPYESSDLVGDPIRMTWMRTQPRGNRMITIRQYELLKLLRRNALFNGINYLKRDRAVNIPIFG